MTKKIQGLKWENRPSLVERVDEGVDNNFIYGFIVGFMSGMLWILFMIIAGVI